ncbi:hypothetical protein HY522_09710 [bacterium]|nr:hypothetical protein [bacterium]
MSKSVYRVGELREIRGDILLGERPGGVTHRSKYLRDIESEVTRLQQELDQMRAGYETEVKTLTESYGERKAAMEAELAEIRRQSESEAKRIRDGAAAEVDAEKRKGHAEGIAQGRKEGGAAVSSELAAELSEMREKVHAARQAFLDRLAASESKFLDTALKIAERIVHRKIEVDPEVVVESVREAVSEIQQNHPIRIRVHPSDVERIEAFRSRAPEVFKDRQTMFIPDETVSQGGCIAETGLEFIDATVEQKLLTLRERLIPRSVI